MLLCRLKHVITITNITKTNAKEIKNTLQIILRQYEVETLDQVAICYYFINNLDKFLTAPLFLKKGIRPLMLMEFKEI